MAIVTAAPENQTLNPEVITNPPAGVRAMGEVATTPLRRSLASMTQAEFDEYLKSTTGANDDHIRWSKMSAEEAETERAIVPELAGIFHNDWRNEHQEPKTINGVTTYKPRWKVYATIADPESGEKKVEWYNLAAWEARNDEPVPGEKKVDIPKDAEEIAREDIANKDYPDLHPKAQEANRKAAINQYGLALQAMKGGVVKDIEDIDVDGDPRLRLYFGRGSHNNWLDENPRERTGEKGGDFTELSPEEQEKDLDQVRSTVRVVKKYRAGKS